jgi:hypothetical protein
MDKIATSIWKIWELDKAMIHQVLLDMVMEYNIGQMALIMKVNGV